MNFTSSFTPLGQQLLTKLHAGASLTITRVVAGAGQTPATATVLSNPKQTLTLRPLEHSGNIISLPVTLVAIQAESAYSLMELGVYAQDPDLGEILYKLCTLTTPISISPTAPMVLRFHLKDVVTTGTSVTVTVSPAGLLTETDLAPVWDRINATEVYTKTYTMGVTTLQAFLDSLPRLLTETMEITVSGTLTSTLTLRNFYGSGKIVLKAAARGGCVLEKGIVSTNNKLYAIDLINLTIRPSLTGDNECVYCTSCSILTLTTCNILGNGKNVGILAAAHAVVTATNCSMVANRIVVLSDSGSTVCVTDYAGTPDYKNNVAGIHVRHGGTVLLSLDAPDKLGSNSNMRSGGIIVTSDGRVV